MEQDIQVIRRNIVTDNHVGVDLVDHGQKPLEQSPLAFLPFHFSNLNVSQPLTMIQRPGFFCWPTQNCKTKATIFNL